MRPGRIRLVMLGEGELQLLKDQHPKEHSLPTVLAEDCAHAVGTLRFAAMLSFQGLDFVAERSYEHLSAQECCHITKASFS